jgi:predicted phosphodiesterase
MLTCYVGDSHGNFEAFAEICNAALQKTPQISEFVSVGDFGFWPRRNKLLRTRLGRPVFFIDGNHEDFDVLWNIVDAEQPTYLGPVGCNATYIPRGCRRGSILYCGGARSISRLWRTPGWDWFPEEDIREIDVARSISGGRTDVLVTHETTETGFVDAVYSAYKAGPEPNRVKVERILRATQPRLHVHGHHHRASRYQVGDTLVVGLDRCDRKKRKSGWLERCTLIADQWGNVYD